MRVVFDIETNGLVNPTKIWVIVCKDIDTGITHIFREVTHDEKAKEAFRALSNGVDLWIGHHCLGFDCPVLFNLLGVDIPIEKTIDTLVLSKLVNYSRDGHSIEDYGVQFGLEKIKFNDFNKYSKELEDYCVRDVQICHGIYNLFTRDATDRHWDCSTASWRRSVTCEHRFQTIVNDLHNNGFGFASDKASKLRDKVCLELEGLDKEIRIAFPSRLERIRTFKPVRTKHGTLNRKDFRWVTNGDLSKYSRSDIVSRFTECPFNPSSHKQIVDVLHGAGWSPSEKTKTHIELEREWIRRPALGIDYEARLKQLSKYGWKINETNLSSLPVKAPSPARTLAKRILLEARRRTLTEWLELVDTDNRIRGDFYGIGAWTHRMAHQNPNTANIPNSTDTNGNIKLLGSEMRSLWIAPKGRLLVGVDAESIQLRIFAHYIDDKEFTNALVSGRKEDKTDPHSLNKQVLGSVCRSRDAAKRFIYALLLGAGIAKLAEVLDCEIPQAKAALDRLLVKYEGFAKLKRTVIPNDARRGWFIGLDGRRVRIKGEDEGQRKHLAMSGYLQNGEAVIMKHATLLWYDRLKQKNIDFKLVDMVHDEWQTECPNDMGIALAIAEEQCKALEEVGVLLKMKCPLKGSYGEQGKWTIGNNWKVTH